jgi:4'-phosphopantetheinyl transferase
MGVAQIRRERRLAGIALRVLLARTIGDHRYDGVAFSRTAAGKPELDGGPISFSVSYSDGYALIGVGRGVACGVDVEFARAVRMSEERRGAVVAAASGFGEIGGSDNLADACLLQAWVRLEALAKARGCGIGTVLTEAGAVGMRLAAQARRTAACEAGAAWRRAGWAVRDLAVGAGLAGAPSFAAIAAAAALDQPLPVRNMPASLEALMAVEAGRMSGLAE